MARSRSSGGSPTKRSFGGAAPSRSAHTAAAPVQTRTATPHSAQPPAVQNNHSAAQTQQAQSGAAAGAGGGMLSGLASTVMQGMAFGTGSAIAHRAVDSIAGPRQVEHIHQSSDQSQSQSQSQGATVCGSELTNFQSCMTQNNSNISSCQFFFDMLSQCQKN